MNRIHVTAQSRARMTKLCLVGIATLLVSVLAVPQQASAQEVDNQKFDFISGPHYGSWRATGNNDEYRHHIQGGSNRGRAHDAYIKVESRLYDEQTDTYSRWYTKTRCHANEWGDYSCTFSGKMRTRWDQQQLRYTAYDKDTRKPININFVGTMNFSWS